MGDNLILLIRRRKRHLGVFHGTHIEVLLGESYLPCLNLNLGSVGVEESAQVVTAEFCLIWPNEN
jgi:hypothetical protein